MGAQGIRMKFVAVGARWRARVLRGGWTRWAAFCAAGLLAFWAIAWLAVPPLARAGIEGWASERSGRAVTIGRVDFTPWTLELALHDIAVASARPGAPPLLEIRRIYIDMELQSLVRWGPVLDAAEVDAPRLRLTREADNRYDIDDLLERWAARPAAEDGAGSGGARFALYNLLLRDGAVDFADRTTGRTHELRALELGIPFLSNLPADRQVTVTPRLAFSLNGSAFDSGARATPFAEDRYTQARLRIDALDLAPLRAYWPAALPLLPGAGTLDARLDFAFTQGAEPVLTVSGDVRLSDVRLDAQAGGGPVSFQSLRVRAASVQPFQRIAHLASVEWTAPRLDLRRDAQGRVAWPGAAQRVASGGPAAAASPPWRVAVDHVAVDGGRIGWRDEGAAKPVALALDGVLVRASSVAWPWQRAIPFALNARVAAPVEGAPSAPEVPGTIAAKAPHAASLRIAGQALPGRGQVAVSVRGLPLSPFGPYWAGALAPQIQGMVDADGGFAWNAGAMVAKVARLSADGVALSCPGAGPCGAPAAALPQARVAGAWAEARRLQFEDAWVRLPERTVAIGRASASGPRLRVERSAQGRWMFEDWRPTAPAEGAAHGVARGVAAVAPWSVRLEEVAVEEGALAFRDALPASPVEVQLSGLRLQARPVVPPSGRSAGPAVPAQVSLSAQVGAGRREPGRIAYEGTLSMAPWAAQGKLQAQHVPLHAFEPYVAPWLNVNIVRAEGGFEGDVRYAGTPGGPTVSVRGNAALDELRVRAVAPEQPERAEPAGAARGEDLLRWRSLALQGVEVAAAPGLPVRVDVRETALSDFFARVVLQKSGRLNLQELVRAQARPAATGATAGDAPAQAAAAPARPAPIVRFGPVAVSAGSVRFTDYFIEPNYSADLSELAGRLSAFSSEPQAGGAAPEMAELELRGRAQGSASLEITGRLNPLARPMALDIRGRVRDLELPPLSPYAVKYAGHGIERGKLSMDVNYRVLPDGQLTAGNKLVLHQLAFGEPVQGAPASLPVRLAAALLADRNGVIDLDLPISGSLNDPQFRLGPVILRALGSLVLKAITSPFSLLANAFAGGEAEQGAVAFAPGSSALDGAAREGLDKVARVLGERPALRLTVVGHALADGERDAWKRERLKSQVLALQQRRQPARASADGAAVAARPGEAADAPAYADALKDLYRRSDIAKPRNLLGLAKDLPVPEMEALLLSQMPVPADAMRELAQARAVAVRDYLAQRGLPMERLFVGAPRMDESAAPGAVQAELVLSTR
ncbi:DUF748 domain-containing protein [Acidovorax sp. NCPPB 2350]|nr:DUF748 domain-containing protein [Acidovorax sp. NCPPB 2350]